MMPLKQVLCRSAARDSILRGASRLADAVRVTLGPRARPVLIERGGCTPVVCNDGVAIAREFELEDPEENLAVRLLRRAAERADGAAGGGGSTAIVLAHAIFADGLRHAAAGAGVLDIRRGLDRGFGVAVEALRAMSRPALTRRQMAQVAATAAQCGDELGELAAEAIVRVGKDGVVAIEESETIGTKLNVVFGMQLDCGYLSPWFADHPDRMEAVLEDAAILLCDRKLGTRKDIAPLIERVSRSGRPLLIVARDIEGEALAALVAAQRRSHLQVCAVRAPGFGGERKAVLQEIADLTGTQVVSRDSGLPLGRIGLEHLGRARRVVVDSGKTTILGGEGRRGRPAKRCGRVAVIKVGAPSEAETRARRDALEEAIGAARAALAEGIVPGGGLALLRCAPALDSEEKASRGGDRIGLQILKRALEAPARQIAENAGVDGGEAVARMLAETGDIGFDAERGDYVDLREAGIVDPMRVVRSALESAVAIAGVLLLAEATMTGAAEPRTGSTTDSEAVPALTARIGV